MNEAQAIRTGRRTALKAVTIGLIILQLCMTLMFWNDGYGYPFFWFTKFDYLLNIAVGLVLLFVFAYLLGRSAGRAIIIKKRSWALVGIIYAFAIIVCTTFTASFVGFFEEGIQNDNAFYDYVLKPLILVGIYSFPLTLVMGGWMGWQIRKSGLRTDIQIENI